MGQGYIDPIIYTEENNALLRQADDYRAEIDMLNKNISGDASQLQAATALLHFAGKSAIGDITEHYDNPATQAEYVYGLLKGEVV